jgi:hypothetical protein
VVKLFPRRGYPKIDLAWGGYYGFPATLQHHLNRNPDMDVHIETQIGEKSQKAINVKYKRDIRRLSIKNSRTSAVLSTWRLASWIRRISLEQIHLEGMKIKAAAFQSLIESHIKDMRKINLHDCAVLSDRNFELILKFISTLTSLDECLIVTPKIKGSPSEFIKFLNNDNIDGHIKYTGNVAEQVSEQLLVWEGLDNQNDNESEEEESEEEDDDEDEDSGNEESEENDEESEEESEESEQSDEESDEESEEAEDAKDGNCEGENGEEHED